jgi:uncharacterized membrane protein YdjX (TVP38/TMEM64 family)
VSEAKLDTKLDAAPSLGNLRRAGQGLVVFCVVAAAVAALRWRHELDPAVLAELMRTHPAAPLVFLALHIVASLTFVPRTMLGFAAGIVFGVWLGLLWAALGGVVGAIVAFAVARYVHAGYFERTRWSRLTALLDRAEGAGWRGVMLTRLVPVLPHSLVNYALGLTRVRVRDFALGTLLGQLPSTIAAVDLGAAGERAMRGAGDWLLPTAVGFAALALTVVIPALLRRRQAAAE